MDGFILMTKRGKLLTSLGIGQDKRIQELVTDSEWFIDAAARRMQPILLNDKKLIVLIAEVDDHYTLALYAEISDTVMTFVNNVDFAFDIIDHILTDPYDAMAVVDGAEKLAYISPVHEKFFGLRNGEATGKSVREVIENTRLHHVVRTGVAEVGQIQKMRGNERVVSRHPIRHAGKIVGAIGRIMFKGPQQLDAMARRITDLETQIATYKKETKERSKGDDYLDKIIGQSLAIQSVRQQIRKIAPLDIPVLIQGESGTGKELVAQALHMLSARQDARLISVNAAALPDSLVESELFGYEAGSFTGADKKGRAGKFELADRGTIFLDEIGDMPLDTQSKLLRVLQDRVVERIGGSRPKHVDFRLCSATNRDLESLIESGKFRLDLFYRISPVVITLPTLEERLEDIPLLLEHFAQELARQYSRPVPRVESDVINYLMDRSWPGNIRQLRHSIERAFVFAETGILSVKDFLTSEQMSSSQVGKAQVVQSGTGLLKDALEGMEAQIISDAIARFNGNKKKAAEYLGVSRSYLYKKLESNS